MSRENVEIAREAWKAFTDRGVDATLDYYAEDCVCEDFPELPDGTTYEGRKGSSIGIGSSPTLGGISSWNRLSS